MKNCLALITAILLSVFLPSKLFALRDLNNDANFANIFGGNVTIATTAGTTTVTGVSATSFGNGGLRVAQNDRLWVNNSGTWQFAGTVGSSITNTTFTISGGLTTLTTASPYLILPGSSINVVIDGGNITTLNLPNISDSLVIGTLTIGKANPSGSVGTCSLSCSGNGMVVLRSISVPNTVNSSTINLVSGRLKLWVNPLITSLTWSITSAGTHSVEYVNATQVANWIYTDLIINNGIKSVAGSFTVNGTLNITSSGALNLSTSVLTLGNSSVLTNSGRISTAASSGWITDNRTSGANNYSGTIDFAATNGGQSIPNATYTNLTLSNTQGTNTLSGSTIVTGVLLIQNSAGNLGLGNHWLTVAKFDGPGHITGSATARIQYTGNTASSLYMDSTSTTTRKLRRLTLNSNAQLRLGNILSIDGHNNNKDTGEVVLNTGAILTSNIVGTENARLRLNYTDTTNRAHPTINIGHSSGTNIGKVVGEIYIEDFFQGGYDKRYRQWGHPLDSAGVNTGMSLNQLSDDIDCYGVVSSGNSGRGSSGNINGLYQSQTTPTVINNSIFKYDESNFGTSSRWAPFTHSGSTLYLDRGVGYMFVMRPSGSSTGGGTSATAPQILDVEGQMNFADLTVTGLKFSSTLKSSSPAAGAGYNLLANPYPTHLDLSQFFSDNTNLNTAFYKYNKSSKNYETYSKSGGSSWVKGGSQINPIIEPMDAFWVQLDNSGTPSTSALFKITQTTMLSNSGVLRSNKLEIDSTHYLNVAVRLTSQNDVAVYDEAAIYLGYNESNLSYKFRSGDAIKFSGTCNELNIQSTSGEKLATKSLDLRGDWIVPLNLKVCKLGLYDFVFDVVTNVDLSKYHIEFVDKLTGKSTPIVVGQNVKVDINAVANEFIEGRFFISIMNSQAKINVMSNSKRVILYPNPVSKSDVAHINIMDNDKGYIQLMDSRGKVIFSNYYNGSSETVNIDLKKYSICEGIYFISFNGQSNSHTVKLSIF